MYYVVWSRGSHSMKLQAHFADLSTYESFRGVSLEMRCTQEVYI